MFVIVRAFVYAVLILFLLVKKKIKIKIKIKQLYLRVEVFSTVPLIEEAKISEINT